MVVVVLVVSAVSYPYYSMDSQKIPYHCDYYYYYYYDDDDDNDFYYYF